MTQIIAVDWSGRARGADEAIWTAVVRDGRLEHLENGLGRKEAIRTVIELSHAHPETVVGLDFAFSFPGWYCEERGWSSGPDAWSAMGSDAERLLAQCEPPFFGRTGTKAPPREKAFRQTDREVGGHPKSVFQIGGAGAVGTGSLRGMPHLMTLAAAGFSIWPFHAPGWPMAVEIYPRLFTPGIVKARHRTRREHLEQRFAGQDPVMRERAAGSEDAFDAAVSALAMAGSANAFHHLPSYPSGAPERVEGQIWSPSGGAVPVFRGRTGPREGVGLGSNRAFLEALDATDVSS